jgi:citrate synthase
LDDTRVNPFCFRFSLTRVKGRKIPINLEGVSASVVLDLGFHWQTAAAFIMIPRTMSMLAYYLEEKS